MDNEPIEFLEKKFQENGIMFYIILGRPGESMEIHTNVKYFQHKKLLTEILNEYDEETLQHTGDF